MEVFMQASEWEDLYVQIPYQSCITNNQKLLSNTDAEDSGRWIRVNQSLFFLLVQVKWNQ